MQVEFQVIPTCGLTLDYRTKRNVCSLNVSFKVKYIVNDKAETTQLKSNLEWKMQYF